MSSNTSLDKTPDKKTATLKNLNEDEADDKEESSYDDDLTNSEEDSTSSPVKLGGGGSKNKYLMAETKPSTIAVNSPTNSNTSNKAKNGKSKSCAIL